MKKILLLVLVLLAILNSCKEPIDEDKEEESLANTQWYVCDIELTEKGKTYYNSDSLNSLITSYNLRLSFTGDTICGGNVGCNVFSGSYKTNKSEININPLIITQAYCPEYNFILNAYSLANKYEILTSNGIKPSKTLILNIDDQYINKLYLCYYLR